MISEADIEIETYDKFKSDYIENETFLKDCDVAADVVNVNCNRTASRGRKRLLNRVCRWCSRAFRDNWNLAAHERTHTGERPFTCSICNASFTVASCLKTHLRLKHLLKNNPDFENGRVESTDTYFDEADSDYRTTVETEMNDAVTLANGNETFVIVRKIVEDFVMPGNDVKSAGRIQAGCNASNWINGDKTDVKTETTSTAEYCSNENKTFDFESEVIPNIMDHAFRPHDISWGRTQKFALECRWCSKAFRDKWNLAAHERIHTGERPFRCSICSAGFCVASNLKSHMRLKHAASKTYHCTNEPWQQQVKSSGNDNRISQSTDYSAKELHTQDSPEKHVSDVEDCSQKWPIDHSYAYFTEYNTTDVNTEINNTGEYSFNENETLDSDIVSDLMEHSFSNVASLRTQKSPLECRWCLKVFRDKWNLRAHERLHTGERPFRCSVCDATFCVASNLKSHMRSKHRHVSLTNFRCEDFSWQQQGENSNSDNRLLQPTDFKAEEFHSVPQESQDKSDSDVENCSQEWEDVHGYAYVGKFGNVVDCDNSDVRTEIDSTGETKTAEAETVSDLSEHFTLSPGAALRAACNLKSSLRLRHASKNSSHHRNGLGQQNEISENTDANSTTFQQIDSKSENNDTVQPDIQVKEAMEEQQDDNNNAFACRNMPECSLCGKQFRCNYDLQVHLRKHKGVKPYRCNRCNVVCTTLGNLRNHIRCMHLKEKRQRCETCGKTFATAERLANHWQVHTSDNSCTIDTRIKSKWECSWCQKQLKSNYNLQEHIRIHTGVKPYRCNQCNMACATLGNLRNHIRCKHLKQKRLRCEKCSKTFATADGLAKHLQVHVSEISYSIYERVDNSDCILQPQHNRDPIPNDSTSEQPGIGSTFQDGADTISDNVKIEVKAETDDTAKASCDADEAIVLDYEVTSDIEGFAFSPDSLTLPGGGKKIYGECRWCFKAFRDRWNLTAHERIHTGERPFHCFICGSSFRIACNLKTHMRLMHVSKNSHFSKDSQSRQLIENSDATDIQLEKTDNKAEVIINTVLSDIQALADSGIENDRLQLQNDEIFKYFCETDNIIDCDSTDPKSDMANTDDANFSSGKNEAFIVKYEAGTDLSEFTLKPFDFKTPGRKKGPGQCSWCLKTFRDRWNLTVHERIHTGEKPFSCFFCDAAFAVASNLKTHIRLKHSSQNNSSCENQLQHLINTCEKSGTSNNRSLQTVSTVKPAGQEKTGESEIPEERQDNYSRRKMLECAWCQKTFRYDYELKLHERKHTGAKPFRCNNCGMAFSSLGNVRAHIRQKHLNEERQQCQVCFKTFATVESLDAHQPIHFSDSSHLKEREMICTPEKPYKCLICNYSCSTSGRFKQHARKHAWDVDAEVTENCGTKRTLAGDKQSADKRPEPATEKPYKCLLCDYSCSTSGRFKQHARRHARDADADTEVAQKCAMMQNLAGDKQTPRNNPEPVVCVDCGRRVWRTNLKRHARTHAADKPENAFKCADCQRSFAESRELFWHMHRAHGVNTNRVFHTCRFCGQEQKTKYLLTLHERTHTGENRYRCADCEKSFPTRQRFERHLRTHTGVRPHCCELCGQRFKEKSHLKTHHQFVHRDVTD